MERALKRSVLAILLALGLPAAAGADPTTNYIVSLTVDSITTPGFSSSQCGVGSLTPLANALEFACKPEGGTVVPIDIGDTFTGRFQIQTDLSGRADGFYDLPLKSFSLTVGLGDYDNATLGQGASCLSFEWVVRDCLDGIRGITGVTDFADILGVDVVSGQITSIRTQFFASSDLPNLTFDLSGPYGFGGASDQWGADVGYGDFVSGTFRVTRVPEPQSLWLLALSVTGIGLACLTRRRRFRSLASTH